MVIKGETKKNSPNLRHSFGLIPLAPNMLDGWDIILVKGEIHSSVGSTKTFLYNIRELRYEQNNIGHQISRIDQSHILKSDTAAIYA